MSKLSCIVAFCLLLAAQVCWGQLTTDAFEKKQFVREGQSLNYRILYPENFDPAKQYPVLLFLHGAGERGSDNEKQLVHGGKLFLSARFRKNYPAVIIFPQCPADSYWANVDIVRNPGALQLTFKEDGEPTVPMQLVMALMDSIQSLAYSKDNQHYVAGLSMGGMGTFEILWRRPNLFAAAVPICGGGHPNTASRYAGEVSLWVFHGAQDNLIFPSYSTEMVIALRKAGGDVNYTLYQDANHNSWDPAFAEPDLIPWIFSQKK